MISIESRGEHYSIKISEPGTGWRGYRVPAHDIDECMQAVEHYYAPKRLCRAKALRGAVQS